MFTFTLFDESTDIWNQINDSDQYSSFITSNEWINFQKTLGKEVYKYLIDFNNQPVGLVYIEVYRRKLQKFAYAPYNPVFGVEVIQGEQDLQNFLKDFKNFAQEFITQQNLTLFRFDTLLPKSSAQNLLKSGFKPSNAPGQAKDAWEINLEQSEEDLRSGMSKSTRYNINKTSREGIEFIKAFNDNHIKAFADLMLETTGRKGFGNYDYTYFKKQFDELNHKSRMDIFLAKKDGKYLAGALVNYHKNTAYYTHGCSTSNRELAKLRAPYFLQWNIMQLLKSEGFKKYNMWGILPQGVNGAISGVSEFKRSFGGYEINYVGPFEVSNGGIKYIIHRSIDWWIYRKDRY